MRLREEREVNRVNLTLLFQVGKNRQKKMMNHWLILPIFLRFPLLYFLSEENGNWSWHSSFPLTVPSFPSAEGEREENKRLYFMYSARDLQCLDFLTSTNSWFFRKHFSFGQKFKEVLKS